MNKSSGLQFHLDGGIDGCTGGHHVWESVSSLTAVFEWQIMYHEDMGPVYCARYSG
jgi:hypothetical protein